MQQDTRVLDVFDVIQSKSPEKTCAVLGSRVISYGELASRVSALSSRLKPGNALIVVKDPIETMIAWLACHHKGISCAVLEPGVFLSARAEVYKRVSFDQAISDVDGMDLDGMTLVKMDRNERAPWTAPSESRFEGFFLLATSRTTGTFKLVQHDYAALSAHHATWEALCPLQEGDLVAAQGLLPFGYGFIVAVTWALWSGRAVNFAEISDEGVKIHPGCTVSALSVKELRRAPRLSRLRLAISSGSMIANNEWDWFSEAYPHAKLLNLVGATESLMPFLCSEDPANFLTLPGYSARVVNAFGEPCTGEAGLFEFTGPFASKYHGNIATDPVISFNGWTRLGDYAIDNGDGTFKFLGRNTVSFDIENALRRDVRVRDCHYTVHNGRTVLLVESSLLMESDVDALLKSLGLEVGANKITIVESLERTSAGKVTFATVEKALSRRAVPSVNDVASYTPEVAFAAVKNMWVRQMHFEKAGHREDGHSHPIDHMTLLARGGLRLEVRGKSTDYFARDGAKIIYIKAGLEHTLTALEDNTTAFCIHALRGDNVTGDILDPESIPEGVNALDQGMAAPLLCHDRVRNDRKGQPMEVVYA